MTSINLVNLKNYTEKLYTNVTKATVNTDTEQYEAVLLLDLFDLVNEKGAVSLTIYQDDKVTTLPLSDWQISTIGY
ncbi:hypothetical protein [Vagococcus humatus]|uniref:Uncharacterized protein n=1 Tax=Vagococcus humatus TaxID=1889241 RepID=A0A429Z6J6_9ENTE|nr:hypothetical protein [Vagococcus humatus]RST89327.1 hypothetical protein C7P63_06020 [Vagococcus humatus]